MKPECYWKRKYNLVINVKRDCIMFAFHLRPKDYRHELTRSKMLKCLYKLKSG